MTRWLLGLLFMAFAVPAQATTYYVATTGSDSRTCVQAQNSGTPLLTIPQGVSCMSGGDTLIIAAGTYTGQQILNPPAGSDGAYTVIKGDPAGARPLLDPTGELPTGQRGLYCSNGSACHHIEIRHLEVYTAYNFVKLSGSSTLGYAHHIRIIDNKFHDSYDSGILINSSATGYVGGDHYIAENEFYNTGIFTPGYVPGFNTIYNPGNRTIVEKNVFHNLHNGVGIWYSGIYLKDIIVRKNIFYNIGVTSVDTWQQGANSYTAIHVSVPGSGHQIYENVIYNSGDAGSTTAFRGILINPQTDDAGTSNIYVYNNSLYNLANTLTYGIRNIASAGGPYYIKNNICNLCQLGIYVGTGGTAANNLTTGTASNIWTNPGSGDFSLKASSAAIDAGTDVGLPYNGSAPDQGAFETILFASCEVATSTTIKVTFTNNVSPPLLPASGATTFTARKNGASNALNGSVTRVGDNILELTLTDTYAGGDTADISWASGNITDSSLVGNSSNQPYLGTLTNQSCTNNVSGASYTLTQARYEHHDAYGSEASPTILPHGVASTGAAENFSNYKVMVGGKIRTRLAVTCGGADCPPTGFYLYYSLDGGSYTAVPDTFGADNVKFCGELTGNPPSGTVTTEQLSTAGTFTAGGYVAVSNAIPTVSGLTNGYKTEMEYCLQYDTDAAGTYDYRLYTQSGTALNTYTVTPRHVITPMAAGGMGF